MVVRRERFNPGRIPANYNQYHQDRIAEMTRAMVAVTERYVAAHRDSINSQSVASVIAITIVPFMNNILQKYSEQDFHRVMAQKYVDEEGRLVYGFDFIGDWKRNHPTAFSIMTYWARQFRRSLNFDVQSATNLVCDIIKAWRWRITPTEQAAIGHLIYRIKRLIFIV